MVSAAQAKLKILSGKLGSLNKLTKAQLVNLVKSIRPDIPQGMSEDGPMWGDDKGVVIAYMDKVDWDYEVGGAAGGNKVYPSIDDLEICKPCVASCGMVEVELKLRRVIKESDFSERISKGKRLSKEEAQKKFEEAKKRRELHLTALQLAKLPLEQIQNIIHRASEENEKNEKKNAKPRGKRKNIKK